MRRPHIAGLAAGLLAVVAVLSVAAPVAAGGAPAPSEPCVPGTIWEDRSSGTKFICIYDELYGGSRWELLSGGQTGSMGWVYRSSTYGCALATVALNNLAGSGADAIVRSYRWPCQTAAERTYQPVGELRVRAVLQRYGSSWSTCRDTGYLYNTTSATGWLAGLDMGVTPDCGGGVYRAWGLGAIYQGGAWRGGSLYTPTMTLR